jgi:hypothetical protein
METKAADEAWPGDTVSPRSANLMKRDWDERELLEIVQMNVMKIVEFLNNFDRSTRYHLATLNEKLTKLESSLEYVEGVALSFATGDVDDSSQQ